MNQRPLYETEDDLAREFAFRDDLIRKSGWKFIKMGHKAYVDYMLADKNNDFIGLAEIKIRNVNIEQYPNVFMSDKKWMAALNLLSKVDGVYKGPLFFFFIRTLDGDYSYQYDKKHKIPVNKGGRTLNTRDRYDVEDCREIPLHMFKKIVYAK